MTTGRVVAVCLGPGGIPKQPVQSAQVGPLGLIGDRHRFELHGGADRAVCLFSTADYAAARRLRVNVEPPGAFGENLLLEGLDFGALRPGDALRVGDQVVLEIHDVREPCATLKGIDPRFPDLLVGRSGFLARVRIGGTVRPGMAVHSVPS